MFIDMMSTTPKVLKEEFDRAMQRGLADACFDHVPMAPSSPS
jgi:hypothetical protein